MWPRLVNCVIGIWLMTMPAVFDLTGTAKGIAIISGALSATFATIAIWEATRPLRWVNLAIGALLALTALMFFPSDAAVAAALSGVVLAGLSLIGGDVKGRFGGGWSSLWTESDE